MMKKYILIFILVGFIITLLVGFPSIFNPKSQVKSLKLVTEVDPIVNYVNYEREKFGLESLKQDSRLMKSAQAKACDMVNQNYWSHLAPDGSNPAKFFRTAGYYYSGAGENLCKNVDDLRCMTLWMESKTHRDIILGAKYKDIGIGRCGNIIVQHFGFIK